jgi:acid phosphatase (class A)
MNRTGLGVLVASLATFATALALAQTAAPARPMTEVSPGFLAGYLPKGATPNSLAILPPAPAAGSATQARDDAAQAEAVKLKGTPRWSLATQDAELHFPAAAETFSCAVGVDINPQATPRLYVLLRRSLADAGLSTYPTKTKYQRARPFMIKGGDICTPADADHLRKDGSYPSGHSAVGWAWALILAEASPDQAQAILARGRAFTQSRVVCNVHWLSDTEEGSVMGAAAVARLHAEPEFRADLEAARAEIAAARAAGKTPTRDCAAEAAALVGPSIGNP